MAENKGLFEEAAKLYDLAKVNALFTTLLCAWALLAFAINAQAFQLCLVITVPAETFSLPC